MSGGGGGGGGIFVIIVIHILYNFVITWCPRGSSLLEQCGHISEEGKAQPP